MLHSIIASFAILIQIASAWVLFPGRRTITRLYPLVKPLQLKAHDVYHRFIREADWHGTFVENCAVVPKKRNASFTDALASLCKTLWRKRNISMTGKSSAPSKILNTVIDSVAVAA